MRNLQGLNAFVESAESGSFTGAAVKLGVTPAAVSKNVVRLEKELQVRLFHRSTRRLALTTEGQTFLAQVGSALRSLNEAADQLTRTNAEPQGRVRITSGISFGRQFILPALAKIARRFPKLEMELNLDNRTVDLVGSGDDIGVRVGELHDSSLIARPICPLISVLVASPAYLRQHGTPATPEDLKDHRVLGLQFASGEMAKWRFKNVSGRGTIKWVPHAQVWTSDPDLFMELAASGEGISQAALQHAAPLLRSGRLKLVLHDQYEHEGRQIFLCYPDRQFLSQRVRVVVEALCVDLAAQPDLGLRLNAIPREWCSS